MVGDLHRTGRLHRRGPGRLHRLGLDQRRHHLDPRRRLRPDRLRARRHPRQPRVRQLPVGIALLARTAGAASLHRRDAGELGGRRPLGLHQPGDPHRHGARVAEPHAGRRSAGILQQGRVRGGRRQPGSDVLVLRRSGRVRSELPLLRPVRRREPAAAVGRAARTVPERGADRLPRPRRRRLHERRHHAGVRARAVLGELRHDQPADARRCARPRHGRELPSRDPAQGRQPRRRPTAVEQQLHRQPGCDVDERPGRRGVPRQHRRQPHLLRRLPVHGPARRHAASARLLRRRRLVLPVPGLARRTSVRRGDRAGPPRRDHQQPVDREAAVPAQLRNAGVPARVRLHVLFRVLPERPADPGHELPGLRVAGLPVAQPHARRQRAVLRPARLTAPALAAGRVHDVEHAARQQQRDREDRQRRLARLLRRAAQRHLLQRDRCAGRRLRHRFADLHAAARLQRNGRSRRHDQRRRVRGRHVPVSARRERRLRHVQHRGAALHGVLAHRSVEADRPSQRQPRAALRRVPVHRLRHHRIARADDVVQRVQPDPSGRERGEPGRRADLHLRRAAAAARRDLHARPAHRAAGQRREVRAGSEHRVRPVRLPAAERRPVARALRRLRAPDHAGPPGPAGGLEQLRLLVRAPVHQRHLGEAHAVPAQDPRPDPELLPGSEDRLHRGSTSAGKPPRASSSSSTRATSRAAVSRRGCRSRTPTATSTTRSWAPADRSSTASTRTSPSTTRTRRPAAARPATRRPAPPTTPVRQARSRTRTTTRRSSR